MEVKVEKQKFINFTPINISFTIKTSEEANAFLAYLEKADEVILDSKIVKMKCSPHQTLGTSSRNGEGIPFTEDIPLLVIETLKSIAKQIRELL